MVILVGACSLVFFVLSLFTLNPVYLVPAVSGAIYVAADLLQRRYVASRERGGNDPREAKEQTGRVASAIMALLAVALAVNELIREGGGWGVLVCVACMAVFLWGAFRRKEGPR
jgi:hypothetical protein